jgi:hypothetical protein
MHDLSMALQSSSITWALICCARPLWLRFGTNRLLSLNAAGLSSAAETSQGQETVPQLETPILTSMHAHCCHSYVFARVGNVGHVRDADGAQDADDRCLERNTARWASQSHRHTQRPRSSHRQFLTTRLFGPLVGKAALVASTAVCAKPCSRAYNVPAVQRRLRDAACGAVVAEAESLREKLA